MDLSGLLITARLVQGTSEWSTQSLLHVATAIAQEANKIRGLTDNDKVTLTCKVLKSLLNEEETKQLDALKEDPTKQTVVTALFDGLEKVVDEVVPVTLELTISAANGKLNLAQAKKSLWARVVSCFFPKGTNAENVSISQLFSSVEERAVEFAEKKASAVLALGVAKVTSGDLPTSVEDAVKDVIDTVASSDVVVVAAPVAVATPVAAPSPAPSPVAVAPAPAE